MSKLHLVFMMAIPLLLMLPFGGHGSGESDTCGLLQACKNPKACKIMNEKPPAEFKVKMLTNVGSFTIKVVTAWSPPFALRFWQLSRLQYMKGARFYRVAFKDFSGEVPPKAPFVVQFGYSGIPNVDNCWDNNMTLNQTAPVVAPGNQRGYVSMSMGAQTFKDSSTPYCTITPASPYCAIGFSTNIFINYGNNSGLDAPGFAIFGRVSDKGMKVVDRLYKEYGDVLDLCPPNGTNVHCNGYGSQCHGINMTQLSMFGNKYLTKNYKRMSYIKGIKIH